MFFAGDLLYPYQKAVFVYIFFKNNLEHTTTSRYNLIFIYKLNYYNNMLYIETNIHSMTEHMYDVILGVGFIVLSILALVQLTATTINKFVEYYAIDDDDDSNDDYHNITITPLPPPSPPLRRSQQRANCNSPLLKNN